MIPFLNSLTGGWIRLHWILYQMLHWWFPFMWSHPHHHCPIGFGQMQNASWLCQIPIHWQGFQGKVSSFFRLSQRCAKKNLNQKLVHPETVPNRNCPNPTVLIRYFPNQNQAGSKAVQIQNCPKQKHSLSNTDPTHICPNQKLDQLITVLVWLTRNWLSHSKTVPTRDCSNSTVFQSNWYW